MRDGPCFWVKGCFWLFLPYRGLQSTFKWYFLEVVMISLFWDTTLIILTCPIHESQPSFASVAGWGGIKWFDLSKEVPHDHLVLPAITMTIDLHDQMVYKGGRTIVYIQYYSFITLHYARVLHHGTKNFGSIISYSCSVILAKWTIFNMNNVHFARAIQ